MVVLKFFAFSSHLHVCSEQRMMNTPQLFDPSTMIPGLVVPSLNEAFLLSEEVYLFTNICFLSPAQSFHFCFGTNPVNRLGRWIFQFKFIFHSCIIRHQLTGVILFSNSLSESIGMTTNRKNYDLREEYSNLMRKHC